MGFSEYADHDAVGLSDLVRRREVSPADLLEAAIERVERHNERLNAVVHRAYDDARRVAAGSLPDGPLRGVPFLLKDLNLDAAGMPRTDGSVALRDRVPAEDAELVRRHRAAGLVIFGKTNTPEFGITGTTEGRLFGPCRNPWNPDHIAGGSSGGAAAAVASGMVPFAHASDGMGSIRIPASCCGLFGMKISRDRNPWWPEDVMRALPLSVHHCVSRSVRDSAALLDATGFAEPRAPWAPPPKQRPYLEELSREPGRLRVAFSAERPDGRPLHPEVKAAVEEAAHLVESLGHAVEERSLPINQMLLYIALTPVASANMAAAVAEISERLGRELREDELEPLTWSIVRSGRSVSGVQALRGMRWLARLVREVAAFFEEVDVHLTPVMATPPPRIGHIDPLAPDPALLHQRQAESFPFTAPFNMTGQPAMSVPLAWSSDGLPIGMQFVARYGEEATLFRLAGQLEQARPWRRRHPPIWG
ncbi:MAG: amidase [Deltaproteobacteria bacterium]|nr:amidase [Deltaproteobacteria bacterium]